MVSRNPFTPATVTEKPQWTGQALLPRIWKKKKILESCTFSWECPILDENVWLLNVAFDDTFGGTVTSDFGTVHYVDECSTGCFTNILGVTKQFNVSWDLISATATDIHHI